MAPGRPRRDGARGAADAHRHRPRGRRRRGDGVRDAGRRAGGQRRPQRRARRRLARIGAWHDDRSPVRFEPAGGPLRSAGCDGRRLRRRRRRRRRGDDAGADGVVDGRGQVRLPVRSASGRPLFGPGRPGAPGCLGRADRRQVGTLSGRARRVRRPFAAARRRGHRRRALRGRDRAGPGRRRFDDDQRRGHPRDRCRDARDAQAVVRQRGRRWSRHRGELVADHRRCGGDAHHERGAGSRARVAAARPVRRLRGPWATIRA